MGRAVRSSSSNSARLAAIAALMLAGCTRSAPPLPPDTTSINRSHDLALDDFMPEARAMSCDDISAERRKIADAMQQINASIESHRTRDQIIGYFTFPTLVVVNAVDGDDAGKDQMTQLYQRQDTLIKLSALKHCAAPTP
jgi:hypothetical protein